MQTLNQKRMSVLEKYSIQKIFFNISLFKLMNGITLVYFSFVMMKPVVSVNDKRLPFKRKQKRILITLQECRFKHSTQNSFTLLNKLVEFLARPRWLLVDILGTNIFTIATYSRDIDLNEFNVRIGAHTERKPLKQPKNAHKIKII